MGEDATGWYEFAETWLEQCKNNKALGEDEARAVSVPLVCRAALLGALPSRDGFRTQPSMSVFFLLCLEHGGVCAFLSCGRCS